MNKDPKVLVKESQTSIEAIETNDEIDIEYLRFLTFTLAEWNTNADPKAYNAM